MAEESIRDRFRKKKLIPIIIFGFGLLMSAAALIGSVCVLILTEKHVIPPWGILVFGGCFFVGGYSVVANLNFFMAIRTGSYLKKFICPHCYKSILTSDLVIGCPFCEKQVETENSIFNKCYFCEGKIKDLECPWCKELINLFASYNEKELEAKRRE